MCQFTVVGIFSIDSFNTKRIRSSGNPVPGALACIITDRSSILVRDRSKGEAETSSRRSLRADVTPATPQMSTVRAVIAIRAIFIVILSRPREGAIESIIARKVFATTEIILFAGAR